MKSLKRVCLFSSWILISAFLMAAGNAKSVIGKWRMISSVQEKMERDSAFKAQLAFVDTMTKLPDDFIAMKEEFAKMDAETKAQIQQEIVDMLLIDDLEVLKNKIKEQLTISKRTSDSLEQSRMVIYNFRNDKVIEFYTTDDIAIKDTSTAFREDMRNNRLLLLANNEDAKTNTSKDTLGVSILYLSADSLSIKFDRPEEDEEFIQDLGNRVMNFKAYKD